MIRVTKPNGKIVVVEVDRTDNSMHKSGPRWKIKYHVCKMLNFLTRGRSKKHRSAWNAIKESVKSNPKINSERLSDLMEKNGCRIYHVDKSIKEKTTGILGRICNLNLKTCSLWWQMQRKYHLNQIISFGLHDMPHEVRRHVLDEMRRVSKKRKKEVK